MILSCTLVGLLTASMPAPLLDPLCAAGPSLEELTQESTASSEEEYGPKPDQFLVKIAGSYTYDNNESLKSESFRLEVGAGYFLTQEHEVGLLLQGIYDRTAFDGGGGDTSNAFRLISYYNYDYMLSTRLTAYAGPHFEILSFDTDGSGRESDFGWGLHVGVRYWLGAKVGIEIEPRYTHRELGSDTGGNDDEFQTLIGLTFVP